MKLDLVTSQTLAPPRFFSTKGRSRDGRSASRPRKRVSRLLEMLTLLQSGSPRNAGALAEWFGVSKTRIYNDIQALREASIPVRRHGRGYKLAEGFFMPPLSLTLREAASLVLPMEFFLCAMPRSRDTLAARQKLLACLAPDVRKRAELLHRRIRATSLLDGTKSHVLEQLLQAIAEQRRVELIGAPDGPRHETALTWFLFDPYRIVYDRGAWYISGYAVSHREVRSFRTTDIEAVKPTPLHFAYPEGTLVDGEPPSASPSS